MAAKSAELVIEGLEPRLRYMRFMCKVWVTVMVVTVQLKRVLQSTFKNMLCGCLHCQRSSDHNEERVAVMYATKPL